MIEVDPGRAARAAIALSDGSTRVSRAEEGVFAVESFSGDETYAVRLEDPPTCTCPDAAFNGATCKHVLAVALMRGLT